MKNKSIVIFILAVLLCLAGLVPGAMAQAAQGTSPVYIAADNNLDYAGAQDVVLTESEVQNAVETWVRYITADARPDAVVERMEPYRVNDETVAYVAHLEGSGFCLCGANYLVLPVYLYSPDGTFDPQNPDYQYILWEIDSRLQSLRKALQVEDADLLPYQDALSSRAAFWHDLVAGVIPEDNEGQVLPLAAPASMELALTSQWHQGSPYNDRCPELPPGSGTHTVVGCVATAMSQIMYYWSWPNTGTSSHSVTYYYRWRTNWDEEPLATNPRPDWGTTYWSWGSGRLEWTSASGGRLRMTGNWDSSVYNSAYNISKDGSYRSALAALWGRLTLSSTNHSANFGATTYNWSILQDVHTDPPDTGDAEVAELCHHAGIAVDMDYGVSGSAASTGKVPGALENYFRYDPDGTYATVNAATMREEIQWLRPLEIRGCRTEDQGGGCHAWVSYGYNQSTSQFLMNMGWGPGTNHVWYTLDSVNLQFTLYQYHATRLAPLNVVKFVGAGNPGDGSPDDPYQDIAEAVIEAPNGATLIFKAGSTNTFSTGPLVIDRPLTLKGYNVTITKE
jgi:hypothetical protein